MDCHVASGEAFGDGGHSCGAGAGAAGHRLAAAPFPNAHLHFVVARKSCEFYIGAVGKAVMLLGHRTFAEHHLVGQRLIGVAYEVRIAH